MKVNVVGCNGKTAYETFLIADRIARKVRRFNEKSFVAPYHCVHCNHFHIGENREHGKRDRRKVMPQ